MAVEIQTLCLQRHTLPFWDPTCDFCATHWLNQHLLLWTKIEAAVSSSCSSKLPGRRRGEELLPLSK